MRSLCAIMVAAFFGLISINSAVAGDSYKFNLHNQSSDSVITGFYTFEDGKWSKNWINFTLKPGEESEMDWGSDEGNCVVPFKVGWKGYEADKFSVDFCKVHNLYMKDSGFKFD
jgi:hypothetical protein